MGKGIGFQTKPGDLIPAERIEKYYPEDDLTVEHMSKVMTKADEKQMAVIYEIVRLFGKVLEPISIQMFISH